MDLNMVGTVEGMTSDTMSSLLKHIALSEITIKTVLVHGLLYQFSKNIVSDFEYGEQNILT